MLKYVTLKLFVEVPDGIELEDTITDLMAQAITPVDEDAEAPPFLIDWVLESEAPVCDEVAHAVASNTYDQASHAAFSPMVLGGFTHEGEFVYWHPSLGLVDQDLAKRYTCPSNEDRNGTYLKDPVFLRENEAHPKAKLLNPETVYGWVRSDDSNFDIAFNAVSWLATEEWPVLLAAAKADWSGADALDEVIYRLQATDPQMRQMLAYCEASQHGINPCGFTCEVDGDAAMAWLQANRPDVHALVQSALTDFEAFANS